MDSMDALTIRKAVRCSHRSATGQDVETKHGPGLLAKRMEDPCGRPGGGAEPLEPLSERDDDSHDTWEAE